MSVYETPESRRKRDRSFHNRPNSELSPVQLECKRAAERAYSLRRQQRLQGDAFKRHEELAHAQNRWDELRKLHAKELGLRPTATPRFDADGSPYVPSEKVIHRPIDGETVLASWKAWCGQVI
jgi:hypothetical protein